MRWFLGFKLHLLINHRSETGRGLNVIAWIVAYCLKKQKPCIKVSRNELDMMTAQ